jgi:hypothetical protein
LRLAVVDELELILRETISGPFLVSDNHIDLDKARAATENRFVLRLSAYGGER